MLLSFINKTELRFGTTLDGTVFEMLMLEPLAVALKHVEGIMSNKEMASIKRRNEDTIMKTTSVEGVTNLEENATKKQKMASIDSYSKKTFPWLALQRCGVVYRYEKCEIFTQKTVASLQTQSLLTPDVMHSKSEEKTSFKNMHLNLSFNSKYDLGKCIDASPLFCSVR